MPWNLFILPLLGGYYIISRSHLFKFQQQRLDRQRLVFDSIIAAILILLFTFALSYLLEINFPTIKPLLKSKSPIKSPYFNTALFSFLCSILSTELLNKILFKNHKKHINKSILKVGNELELLLRSSLAESKMLIFTLDTGKFYIAWVKELPIPAVTNYIRVIPIFSGYRNKRLEMIFTTQYLELYTYFINKGETEKINHLEVDLVLTLKNIVTVSHFNIDLHETFDLNFS